MIQGRWALFLTLLPLLITPLISWPDKTLSAGVVGALEEWEVGEPARSWALGLVVPEGAPLASGGRVRWGETSNLTVTLTLPDIKPVDGVVYIILSAMTEAGTILQLAAGLYPDRELWSTYSMYVVNLSSPHKAYILLSNGTAPFLRSGETLSLTIYSESKPEGPVWVQRVYDHASGLAQERPMLADGSATFKPGEQEVIALESYTSRPEAFRGMELTLWAILLDGERVAGGWYVNDGWAFTHNPLFVVGGGARVPPFIALREAGGIVVWTYSEEGWPTSSPSLHPSLVLAALIVALVAAPLALIILLSGRRAR
jgi:hypothetical protein